MPVTPPAFGAHFAGLFDHHGLNCRNNDAVIDMPFFQQHRKMCPENQVHPDVTVFLAEKK